MTLYWILFGSLIIGWIIWAIFEKEIKSDGHNIDCKCNVCQDINQLFENKRDKFDDEDHSLEL